MTSMLRTSRVLACLLACTMLYPFGALAATERVPPVDCTRFERVAARLYRQSEPSTSVTNGLAGMPDRVFSNVRPGERGSACIGFHNRTGSTVTLTFAAEDVGAARSGVPTTTGSQDAPFGAAAWLQLPAVGKATLAHGDIIWLDVGIDVPQDSRGGSSYAAVVATVVDEGRSDATQARVIPSIAVQLFLDVPGDLDRSGRFEDVRMPRVIWWDGAGIGELPVLDRLRGPGVATLRFDWHNTGSVTQEVGGDVLIESSLGGRDVTRLSLDDQLVLRDARRSYEVTWKRDIPMLGRFTPTIRLDDGDDRPVRRELPAVWVIPAWWYLLLVALAAVLPIWLRRRSRQRYDELVARLEDAEQRVAVHEDPWGGEPYDDER